MPFTSKITPYKVYELDLSSPRTDEALGLDGMANTITIMAAPANFSYKINSTDNDSIDAVKGLKQDGVSITEVYISNEAGSGTAKIFLSWVI